MSAPFTHHVPDSTLEAYARGELCESEAATHEEHLLICQECRNRLIETEECITAAEAAASEPDGWSGSGFFWKLTIRKSWPALR